MKILFVKKVHLFVMKRPHYTTISSEIKAELASKFNVEDLSLIKLQKFQIALKTINDTIADTIARTVVEKGIGGYELFFETTKNPFFQERSLRRYFKGSKIRSDNLAALKCFLGYTPDQLGNNSIIEKRNPKKSLFESLYGKWSSYVYDLEKNVVKKTSLFLQWRNENYIFVQYHGISGHFTGSAEINKNSILFSIKNKEKNIQIYLCAELPNEELERESNQETILNVYCLSNSFAGQPVVSNVIMIKEKEDNFSRNKNNVDRFLEQSPKIVSYGNKANNKNEDAVIQYLFRNKTKNDRLIKFLPNNFHDIIRRNNLFYRKNSRDNYDRLKIKLNNFVCYSFNRSRQEKNEVAVFSYTFEFSDEEQKVNAYRHPINNPSKIEFSGEAFIENEKLVMAMIDQVGAIRHKLFIAPFHCRKIGGSRNFTFHGITSTISSQTAAPFALRELIVCLEPNENVLQPDLISDEDNINGFISYESFKNLKILTDDEKLFLADILQSTLTYPPDTPVNSYTYNRQNRARKYAGTYYIFLFYPESVIKSTTMVLTIDRLSQVVLEVSDENDNSRHRYEGICEFFNPNLRVSVNLIYNVDHQNEKHLELIFDPIKEIKFNILTGITLTTDDESNAVALRFLSVKKEYWEKANDYKKTQLYLGGKKSESFKKLSDMALKYGIDISKF